MVANMKRIFALYGISAKLDLLWFLRDTKNCVLNIMADLVSSLSTILAMFLLSQRFDSIGGMSSDHILFMLGFACLLDGLNLMFFTMNNVGYISRIIGRGQLDHKLIQPNPIWMQLLTDGFIPFSGSSTFLCGIGLIAFSSIKLNLNLNILDIGFLIFYLICSVIIIFSFSYIFSCIAFYAPVAGEEVSTAAVGLLDNLKGFPLGGIPYQLQIIFTTILPIGMTAWYPANLLLGNKLNFTNYLLIIVTLSLLLIATILFRKGLKHYATKGSIRYADRGHRR
jgi:ABC-2 type transport system permease protein